MATYIPAFSTCAQRMTVGERRLAQRLEDKLEDADAKLERYRLSACWLCKA